MSKFTSFYNLCPIHETKELIENSPDSEDGNIITTLGRNMIVVINVNTQKQIHSWSVLEKLSSKVVFDRKCRQYVAVFANQYLRCWDHSITDINKCKKLKFHKNIADLVSDGSNTLVLYADGTCESLATALELRKKRASTDSSHFDLTSNTAFTQAKIWTVSDSETYLTYFEKQSDNIVKFIKIGLTFDPELKSNGEKTMFDLQRGIQDVSIAGYAVIDGHNSPMLLTIWSDKRLFLLHLNGHVSGNTPGNFVSTINSINVDNPVSILGISKNCIAIYGANSPQEGASLMLYNTQFKVIKTKQYFKIYFSDTKLWSMNSYILMAMGQNLSVISYTMTEDLLSELVGSQISNNFQTAVEGDYINEEYSLEECLQYSSIKTKSPVKKPTQMDLKKTSNCIKEKTMPFESYSSFEKEIQFKTKFNMHVDVFETNGTNEPNSLQLMSNYTDNGFQNQKLELILRQLEMSGASEHEITEKLLTVLNTSDFVEDASYCLKRYTNVSPKMLAKTMKNAFKGLSGIQNQDFAAFIDENKNLKTQNKYLNLLDAVLWCSFDADTIEMHIRKEIEYKHVLFLLEYLLHLITSKCDENNHEVQDFDSELHILRWFGIFLNTHFQKLALSGDLKLVTILQKWHEYFVMYKQKIEEIEQLSALLYNLVREKNIIKEKHHFKWYSIEEFQLY